MNLLSPFQIFARRLTALIGGKLSQFSSSDPLMIQPYRGYANAEQLFFKGRVLEDEGLSDGNHNSRRLNLLDSFKRMETDEVPNVPVEMNVEGQTFQTLTDHEGYFIVDQSWQAPVEPTKQWYQADLTLLDHLHKDGSSVQATGEVFIPSPKAEYGIISDIDDTVLQTFVTSKLKLRMLYATFFKNANQRLPMEGIVELFQTLEKGKNGDSENPFFYVSSSPWNIYDMLEQFMTLRHLPKGPILLRDYGIDPSGPFLKHKLATIARILETYPKLPFIMLGDTASSDGDYYLELAKQFPGQVKAIYIRQTKDTRNARRMKKLLEEQTDVMAVMMERSVEIEEHAKSIGLI